ncbi:hypothetical protein Cantr_06878 [Candida viswanathii]|uniref:Uncharacterized protein n=1 Tax=Candida viswanathii TaxID=5486 RepID=A0A367XUM6_9ASCO|nr:hypothetical protein Cantr_06878 [Candida viswanathii]
MKFVTWFIYFIKINFLQMVLNGSRNPSISLQYIQSSIFEQTPTECTCDCSAENDLFGAKGDSAWMNNLTDVPILSKECEDEPQPQAQQAGILS